MSATSLALLLNALRGAQKELRRELSEDESLQVLQRERKKRAEAMEAYDAAGREEQADREEFELDVIEEFMPEPLSEDEIEEIVDLGDHVLHVSRIRGRGAGGGVPVRRPSRSRAKD